MKPLLIFFMLLFLAAPVAGFSQVSTSDTTKSKQIFVVTKNDGNQYTGVIITDDGREVLMETETLGKIYIPKSDIKSIVKVEDASKVVDGVYEPTGPFTTRYAFTTNALPIKKGENYAMLNLYGPEAHFAVTNHFSLGVMSTWIGSPFLLAAKYSFATKNEKVNFSIGSLNGTTGYINSFRGFGGLHFANVTIGSRTKNVTFGAGYAYLKTGNRSIYYTEGVYYDSLMYAPYNMYNGGTTRPMCKGPVFSFAAIAKTGDRASLVIDAIVGVFSQPRYNFQTTEITPPSYVPPYSPGYYKHVVTKENVTSIVFVLMPGMRFQKTDRKAFQVSIAGITWRRLTPITYIDTSGGNFQRTAISFPFPMCTWFFKF